MSYADTIPSKNYYHDFLIKSMKYYNISLNNGKEFWTLGAQKWHEYDQLVELGIDFTDGLYCNVDRSIIDHPGTRKNCIAYPNREFHTIWEVWKNPYIISYDSVHGAVRSNRNLWNGVCGLATAAAKKTSSCLFGVNMMYGYFGHGNNYWASTPSHEAVVNEIQYWVKILQGKCIKNNIKLHMFNDGAPDGHFLAENSQRDDSSTTMIHFVCYLEKVK